MKAPEKVYLEKIYLDNGVLPNGLNYNQSINDIEYVYKDAFIEKACEWLSKHFYDECYQFYDNDGMWIDADSMLEDFKNYMKGK